RQPNPQRKEQHQENSRSFLPFSFSPCSLIKGTRLVSGMLARRDNRRPLVAVAGFFSRRNVNKREIYVKGEDSPKAQNLGASCIIRLLVVITFPKHTRRLSQTPSSVEGIITSRITGM